MLKYRKHLIFIAGTMVFIMFFGSRSFAQIHPDSAEKSMVKILVNAPGQHDTAFLMDNASERHFSVGNSHTSVINFPVMQEPSVVSNNANHKSISVVKAGITLKITTSPASCGHMNGSMIVIASGGTAPYTFSYSYLLNTTTQNTGNFPNLFPGTYNVIVTDANGLSASVFIDIETINEPPTYVISGFTNPTTCSSFDGSITYSASGGTPPYTYSLDRVNFQTSATFENLCPGFYTAFVKDAIGCISSTSAIFFGSTAECWAISFGHNGLVCNNNGFIEAKVFQGGMPPFQYSIDGVNYQSSGRFVNLGSGIMRLYIKDATGVVNVYSITTFPGCPGYSYTATPASCNHNDGTITISASYGTAPYLFTLDGINYQTSPVFNGLRPGNYTFTVKDANGISYSDLVTIESDCPTVSALATDETCGGKNGTITATPEHAKNPTYSIDGIHFQSSNVFAGLAAGNYMITIKDADGNISTAPATVESSCISLSLAITNTVCSKPNGSIAITADNGKPPYQYSLNGAGFQSGNTFYELQADSYTLYIKDANNALRDTTVTLSDAPAPELTVTLSQAGCDKTNGSLHIATTGGTAPIQYSIDGINYQNNGMFDGLDTGKYVAYVKDANGCINQQEKILTSVPIPKVFLGNDTIFCRGKKLELAAPLSPGLTYEWQDKSNSHSYSVTKGGIYFVKVTNKFGCSAADTINVLEKTVPAFTIGRDTSICEGDLNLLLEPVPVVEGNYSWNTGATGNSLLVTESGYYRLDINNQGCIGSADVTIQTKTLPGVNLGNDTTLCEGTGITLNAGFRNSTYTWQDGATGAEYEVDKPGQYTVAVDLEGCITKDTVVVSYLNKPQFILGADTTICPGQEIHLQPKLNVAVNYVWQDGSTQPYFTVKDSGLYQLKTKNICGSYTDDIYVGAGNCKLILPNAFTPNSDGLNDIFKVIYPLPVTEFRFVIYNRFGEKIFEATNMKQGWDGTYKGEPQPAGQYVWKIQITETGKVPYMRKGVVSLIR